MTNHISKSFEYSYDVPDNSIDINALLVSQLHLTTIVNEVAKTINPDIELNIRIIAPKQGSFVWQQLIEYTRKQNLLSKDNIELLSNIFGIIGGIFQLKSWLKGKKADKVENNGDNVNITFNGETKNISINVYNIYTKDKIVNSAIQKAYEAIETDDSINGLTIKEKDNDNIYTNIERKDFNSLVSNNEYLDSDTQEEIKPSVKLFIKKPDFVPKNSKSVKWDFLYEGITKIKATIKDERFLNDIAETVYRVGAWDSLLVDMKVISKYNEEVNVYLPDSYEIVKVHKVIYREKLPIQTEIDTD